MSNTLCPHCGGEIAAGALYCRHCTRRAIRYIACPSCQEPIADDATYCPYCTQKRPTEQDVAVKSLNVSVEATRLGAWLGGGNFTGLFFPPVIAVSGGRIRVTRWTLLGLRTHHQEIQVSRVASVRYTKGVFWGGLLVETFGGAAEDISEKGLRQEDARYMAEQLKSVLSERF
jgi:hypothetical protein